MGETRKAFIGKSVYMQMLSPTIPSLSDWNDFLLVVIVVFAHRLFHPIPHPLFFRQYATTIYATGAPYNTH